MTRNAIAAALAALLLGGGVAACGTSAPEAAQLPAATSAANTAPPVVVYNQSQIMRWLKLKSTDGDISWQTPRAPGCNVSVILKSTEEVTVYGGPGTYVATNPSESAGVKFGITIGQGDQTKCGQEFTAMLRHLPAPK